MVWLSEGEAMVKLIPMAIAPHYCCRGVYYLPAKVMIPPVVSRVSCVDKQELWMVQMGVWYPKELVGGEPSPSAPSGAARACHGE